MATTTTERRGQVFLLGLDRPDENNALDEPTVAEIHAALDEAAQQPCVLVVHSTTPEVFAAGAHIAELLQRAAAAAPRAVPAGLFERLEGHRWPTIAVVDGPALGGGCELALACDLRIATPRARFGQPELDLGVLAGAGANWRLPQLVGLPTARRMLYAGEVLDAEAARTAGLVDVLAPAGSALSAGLELADRIASRPWRALELTKLALRVHRPAPTTFDLAAQARLFEAEDERARTTRFPEAEQARRGQQQPERAAPPAAGAARGGNGARPEPRVPLHVRPLTIEDGLDLAAARFPGAWGVQDALEPPRPDEGFWAVADDEDRLLGYCCFGEAARVQGAEADPSVLDIAIGIRPQLAGRGWGVPLGLAAVAHARSVALDRRLRTTLPEWNEAGRLVAAQAGFQPVGVTVLGSQRYLVLEQV